MSRHDNVLAGLTRLSGLFRKAIHNPGRHNPVHVQDKIIYDVVGPDGVVKCHREVEGNVLTTYGLNRMCELFASGGEASNFVSAGAIGTSTTAANSTQSALVASTGIVHISVGSIVASDGGDRTLQYNMTFASNNPAGAAAINEVGLFATNAASAAMVGRSVLGTDSINKGASDAINMTYKVIFATG